jgi:hypothetical protein
MIKVSLVSSTILGCLGKETLTLTITFLLFTAVIGPCYDLGGATTTFS